MRQTGLTRHDPASLPTVPLTMALLQPGYRTDRGFALFLPAVVRVPSVQNVLTSSSLQKQLLKAHSLGVVQKSEIVNRKTNF
jgi:hypothetical protein